MSALERRIQLLVDQQSYDKVASNAQLTGTSVNAVIRQAIDLYVPDAPNRPQAIAMLLEFSEGTTTQSSVEWADEQEAMDEALVARWG